jgi:nucleoside-diphosphate-sugar epimerase
MKVIIIGGGGLIGGATAFLLKSLGREVVLAGRTPPAATSPLSNFPFTRIDYLDEGADHSRLREFDAVVFSAGNDVRHKPPGAGDEYWQRANSEGIPRFFEALSEAGVRRAVNVGSFYPQAAQNLVETNAYVRSRRDADVGIAALASPDFAAISVNAPLVIGLVPGVIFPMLETHIRFALGELPHIPDFVPPGGVNFISTRSTAEAIVGALERGAAGASYLIGDENLTYQQYFGAYFEAAGRPTPPVRDEEAPIFPDRSIYVGRGNSVFYEPDPEEARLLGYRRNDVIPAIRELVANHIGAR